jgi:predicted dehydrogenase
MGLRHVLAVQRCEGVELLGGCDLRAETASALRERADDARFFDDFEAMLGDAPEIVVIATNAPSHRRLFEQALDAGVRRFVIEKPVTASIDDALAIRDLAARADARVVVNISRRYSPLYNHLRHRLSDDVVGEPASFHAVLGASGLGCNGTHLLDLGVFLLDAEPELVVGFLDDRGLPNPRGEAFHDPGAFGVVRCEGGTRVMLDMGEDFGVQGKYQLFGRYGRLIIDEINRKLDVEARDEAGRQSALSRVGTPLHRTDDAFDPPLDVVAMASRAIADAAGDGEVICGMETALTALRMVVAFHLSDEAGNVPVRIADVDELAADRAFKFT